MTTTATNCPPWCSAHADGYTSDGRHENRLHLRTVHDTGDTRVEVQYLEVFLTGNPSEGPAVRLHHDEQATLSADQALRLACSLLDAAELLEQAQARTTPPRPAARAGERAVLPRWLDNCDRD